MNQVKIEKYIDRVAGLSDAEIGRRVALAQRTAKIIWWLGIVLIALSVFVFVASWMDGGGFRQALQNAMGAFFTGLIQIMVSVSNRQQAITLMVILRLRQPQSASATSPSPESIPQA